jgi:4-hydroxybenzoate polyprenyltransferase
MRPLEWSKSFGNMLIAAVTAGILMQADSGFLITSGLDTTRFLVGFVSLALLWGGLYALNDYTDRKADALHPEKKKRAIPSGRVPARVALVFSFILIAASIIIALYLNETSLFLVCVLAMLANQLMYTMKPFSLKKRPVVDLISGSLVNPIFRFYAGWVLFVPAFNAPWQVLLFILGIQFGGFGMYRMYSKEHEKRLGLKSSVVKFGEKNLKRLAYVSIAVGALSYIYATFTVLPISYLFLGLAMLLFTPFYRTALKRPQDINHKKMYWLVYAQYLVFLAGFLLLHWLKI